MIKWGKTTERGIRFYEHVGEAKKRKYCRGKPDRCFVIRYKRHGKTISEAVGWTSEGITPQCAKQIRGQIVSNIRVGQGFQSLKEKRGLENTRRETAEANKEAIEKENTPFSVLAEKYLEWAETSKKTLRDDTSRYKFHIEPVLGDVPIKDVSVIHLERLKRETQKKGLSPATVKHVLVLTRQIFNKAIGWGLYAKGNPIRATLAVDKKFLKTPDNKRVSFLSYEQADELLSALADKSIQVHDIAILSLYAGLRLGEAFNLKWADIDLQNGIVHVKDAKSGGSRTAYITEPIKEMFERRMSEGAGKNELVFKDHKGVKIRELSNTFQYTVDRLGFNKGLSDRRDRVVGHTLRHTFASWLAMAGTPIVTIQKLMGHKSIEMTLRYAHLSPSHEREAVSKLADRQSKVVALKAVAK